MNEERFLPVAGFSTYLVGDRGTVVSLRAANSRRGVPRYIMVGRLDKDEYREVGLYRYGKRHYRRVHQLVLEAFVGPRPVGCSCVRHLDGNPKNNVVGNLLWGTDKENAQDAVRHGRKVRGEKHHNAKITMGIAERIRGLVGGGRSLSSVAREFGLGFTAVQRIVRNITWRTPCQQS